MSDPAAVERARNARAAQKKKREARAKEAARLEREAERNRPKYKDMSTLDLIGFALGEALPGEPEAVMAMRARYLSDPGKVLELKERLLEKRRQRVADKKAAAALAESAVKGEGLAGHPVEGVEMLCSQILRSLRVK